MSAQPARQHEERFVGGREHSLLLLRVEVAGVGRDGAEGHRRRRVGPRRRQDLRCRCRWRWGRSPRHRAVQAAWLHGSELDQDDLPALCTLLEGRRSRWPRRPLRSIVRWQAHLRLRRLLRRRSLGLRRGRVQLGAALGAELGGGRALRAALPARDHHRALARCPRGPEPPPQAVETLGAANFEQGGGIDRYSTIYRDRFLVEKTHASMK